MVLTLNIYLNDTSVLAISPNWETLWDWINNYKNSDNVAILTCEELRKHHTLSNMEDDEFLGFLEHFSKAGVIGLFPSV